MLHIDSTEEMPAQNGGEGKKQKADNVSGLMGEGGLWQYAKECPDRLPALSI